MKICHQRPQKDQLMQLDLRLGRIVPEINPVLKFAARAPSAIECLYQMDLV